VRRIERAQAGHLGDVHALGEGLSEMRIHYGPGYRLYLAQRGTRLVILLCGGDKSSQAADIRRARTMARDYDDDS
jgi:putative addiction module killer protein